MSLFAADTHFVAYMNAKDPTLSQEVHSREALVPVFADLNKYDATRHFVGQSTVFTIEADRAQAKLTAWNIMRSCRTSDARVASLPRYVCEVHRGVALCRAPALRRLAGRTQLIISAASRMSSVTALPAQERTDTPMRKSKRLAIVGATGMVGGYAL
jgi:hypothetical protein